jgi:hypothetical protein
MRKNKSKVATLKALGIMYALWLTYIFVLGFQIPGQKLVIRFEKG